MFKIQSDSTKVAALLVIALLIMALGSLAVHYKTTEDFIQNGYTKQRVPTTAFYKTIWVKK